MIDFLQGIDNAIFLFFNGLHTPILDRFMILSTGRFVWVPMYIALFLILLRQYGIRRVWVYALAIALAIVLADQVCSQIFRPLCERLRPSNPDNPLSALTHIVDGYRGGRYGMPSCHAANSFALATFLTVLFRRRRFSYLIFIWAALNSYTRIYLGVHYPGDLLAGATIGSLFGAATALIGRTADYALLRRMKALAIAKSDSDPLAISKSDSERLAAPMLRIPVPVGAGPIEMTPFAIFLTAAGATLAGIILAAL